LKHGGYSPHLLPGEQEAYETLRTALMEEFGDAGKNPATVEVLVHRAAFAYAKIRTVFAVESTLQAVTHLNRMLLQALRELKELRRWRFASRPVGGGSGGRKSWGQTKAAIGGLIGQRVKTGKPNDGGKKPKHSAALKPWQDVR
jgi:hypothetical protein